MISLRPRPRLAAIVLTAALVALGTLAMGQRALARTTVQSALHQTAPTGHTISVSGHGEVSAAPDTATLTVGVHTKNTDAQSALSANSTKLNAVIAAIQAQGVPADHIKTSDLSLYQDSQTGDYQASHDLTVSLDNVSKVGAVLDAAVAAGANDSWGVSFGLKNSSVQQSQALTAAVADARRKADALAGALGVTVSGVSTVSESSYTPPIPYAASARAAAAPSAATQVQPGLLTTSADVNVTYNFG